MARKAKRSLHDLRPGDALPDGGLYVLHECPAGLCVRLSITPIDGCACARDAWFIVSGRVETWVRVRRLVTPPSDPAWADSPEHSHLLAPTIVVIAMEWPRRKDTDADEVADPLAGLAGSGPLFQR